MAQSIWTPDHNTLMRIFPNLLPKSRKQLSKLFEDFLCLDLRGPNMLQHDNTTVHKTMSWKSCVLAGVEELERPPQNLDLNPTEHLWDELKYQLHMRTSCDTKPLVVFCTIPYSHTSTFRWVASQKTGGWYQQVSFWLAADTMTQSMNQQNCC